MSALLAGENGIVGIAFDNAAVAYFGGSVALAIILFDSGFEHPAADAPARGRTRRGARRPSACSRPRSGSVAAFSGSDSGGSEGFLLGAIVSSTDAAAVFLLRRIGGITLRDRVRATLEIESGQTTRWRSS